MARRQHRSDNVATEPDPALVELRTRIDAANPTGYTEDGRPFWRVRCWSPFRMAMQATASVKTRVHDDGGDDEDEDKDGDEHEYASIQCVASSTSVDSYGTEMSKACLDSMRAQCVSASGVPILPSHGSWFEAPEWDAVIGRTIDASVDKGSVENGYDGKSGYLMPVTAEIYDDEEAAKKLLARVKRKQAIGMSIGGWFVEVTVIADKDGEVERMIVEEVDLDHIAVTRRPSNPDCVGITAMRSALATALRAAGVVTHTAPVPDEARRVAPFADLPAAPEDTKWSFGAEDGNKVLGDPEDWAAYLKVHAWYDPDDRESKAGYKLPIGKRIEGELKVVWHGVSAAMSALHGGRGGVDIPESDRRGVHNLLARYYAKWDKTPPDFNDAAQQPDDVLAVTLPADADAAPASVQTRSDLDNAPAPGDATDQHPADVQRDAPPVDAGPDATARAETPPEAAMPTEPTNEILDLLRAMQTRLDAIESRVAAPVPAPVVPAPAPVVPAPAPAAAPTDDVAALRAQLDKVQGTLERVLAQPQRRGVQITRGQMIGDGPLALSGFDDLLTRASTGPDAKPGIAAAAKSFRSRILDEKSDVGKISRDELEMALRALCCAAEADGVITDPRNTSSWAAWS